MPRKRHKKSPKKTALPGIQNPAVHLSPVEQIVANNVTSEVAEGILDSVVRVMMDSAELAQEPEFIDLALDSNRAAQVTERWGKKFEKRLQKAEKQGPDEYQQVFDDMRIKIIDELATPEFRQEVTMRLQMLHDRLQKQNNPEKLELVLLLQTLLSLKNTPWGLCGLILTIYSRSLAQKIQAFETEQKLFTAFQSSLEEAGEKDVSFDKLLQAPDKKLEKVAENVFEKNPDLRELAEKHAWDIVEQFEESLLNGEVPLELFTEEELLAPFRRIEEIYEKPITDFPQSEERQQIMAHSILQAVEEMMTPERYQRFRQDIASTIKVWMRKRDKWAYVLELELSMLEDPFENNPFIINALIGQIRRSAQRNS